MYIKFERLDYELAHWWMTWLSIQVCIDTLSSATKNSKFNVQPVTEESRRINHWIFPNQRYKKKINSFIFVLCSLSFQVVHFNCVSESHTLNAWGIFRSWYVGTISIEHFMWNATGIHFHGSPAAPVESRCDDCFEIYMGQQRQGFFFLLTVSVSEYIICIYYIVYLIRYNILYNTPVVIQRSARDQTISKDEGPGKLMKRCHFTATAPCQNIHSYTHFLILRFKLSIKVSVISLKESVALQVAWYKKSFLLTVTY